jgi:hypothetical protein
MCFLLWLLKVLTFGLLVPEAGDGVRPARRTRRPAPTWREQWLEDLAEPSFLAWCREAEGEASDEPPGETVLLRLARLDSAEAPTAGDGEPPAPPGGPGLVTASPERAGETPP